MPDAPGGFDHLDTTGAGGQRDGLLTAASALVDVGALRRDVEELRAGLGDVRDRVAHTRTGLDELRADLGTLPAGFAELGARVDELAVLGEQVTRLASSVEKLLTQDPAGGACRPVNLTQVPADERPACLENLASWLRDVLFTGWPWAQELLRPCWPQHPGIVQDLLLLRSAYACAYEDADARAHHGADFRRWLHEIAAASEETTRDCAQPGTPGWAQHSVPLPARDDTAMATASSRTAVIAQVYALIVQGNDERLDQDLRDQALVRADALCNQHGIEQAEYLAYAAAREKSEHDARERKARRPRSPR